MYDYNYYNNYYQQPSIFEDPLFDYLLAFLFFGFFLFVAFLNWFINRRGEQEKYKILKSITISSPIWIIILLFFLIIGIFSIINREANVFVFVCTLIISYIFLYLYYLMAAYPAFMAYNIINILDDVFGDKNKSKIITFWTQLDKIKNKRLLLILFLLIFLALVIFLDIGFLSAVISRYYNNSTYNYSFFPAVLLVSLVSLLVYLAIEISNCGKVNIPTTEHKKSINLRRVIEKLSLTTGVPSPDFKILAHNNPTAFSVFPNFGEPTIYITAPLLNIADDNELEAVIGHEFAHIYSGRVLYFKKIQNILIVLRVLAFFLLFLVLASIDPYLLFFWFFLLGYSCINILERTAERKFLIETMFKFLNPPLALVNLLSYSVYYAIARNEEFYADLKTVEFTRYPRGIYSILQKLKNYEGARDPLPNRFGYLYFTAEDTTFEDIPMPQPLIESREEILEKTDETLEVLPAVRENKGIKCPNCADAMERLMLKGFYNFLKADYCKRCDSFWFEDFNFWCLNPSPFNNAGSKETSGKETIIIRKLQCPKCGVNLLLLNDKSLPDDVKVWYCPVCNGNWISKKSVLEYLTHREKIIKDKKR